MLGRTPMRIKPLKIERMTNSQAGNPVWRVRSQGDWFRTLPDAQCAYQISTSDEGKWIDIELDHKGKIVKWARSKNQKETQE